MWAGADRSQAIEAAVNRQHLSETVRDKPASICAEQLDPLPCIMR